MDWQVTVARVRKRVAAGASAAGDLAARFLPRLARRSGVVSVFIDGKSLTVAVLRPSNSHSRLESVIPAELDQDALAEPAAAGEAVRAALQGLKKPPRAMLAVLGAEFTFERRIALPPMPVSETDAAVAFQADRVLPFPSGEMRCDYAVESTAPDGVQSVILSAITTETADKVEAIARAAGLALAGIVAAPVALYAATAGADEAPAGTAKGILHKRHGGIEIAVGTSRAAAISRFVRNGASADAAGEFLRTASSAGIAAPSTVVYATRSLAPSVAPGASGFEVRTLEDALHARLGSAPGDMPGAAAAVAAGMLHVTRVALPNFSAPASATRVAPWTARFEGRSARYALAAACAALLVMLVLGGYWIRTLMLEAKANRLAAANAPLKAAVARADTARPWTTDRATLLDVLAGVTEVFPDSSGSFVKSLSVAESGKVSMQGKVDNPNAAYDLVAALSAVKGLSNVKLDSGSADSTGGYSFGISFEADEWRSAR